jgi:hypothetical protein
MFWASPGFYRTFPCMPARAMRLNRLVRNKPKKS